MSFKETIENETKSIISKIESKLGFKTKIAIGLAILLFSANGVRLMLQKPDTMLSSVMITNPAGTSGGSGVILKSQETVSTILTNSHVCKVIEHGGLVVTKNSKYAVTAYKHSKAHDLCFITVDADLGINTKIASEAPLAYYDMATISGYPRLMPNTLSTGHFSGRSIIEVIIGSRACTEEDLKKDPQVGLICVFNGGLPIVKRYEAVLVTATIMAGSSGSGVFNKNNELAGLVFAGGGDFGYAWTVSFQSLKNFINIEQNTLEYSRPNNLVNIFGDSPKETGYEKTIENMNKMCLSNPSNNETLRQICDSVKNDVIYIK